MPYLLLFLCMNASVANALYIIKLLYNSTVSMVTDAIQMKCTGMVFEVITYDFAHRSF